MRAVRQLPFSVDPVVEDRATVVEFGLDFGSRFERRTDEPLVLMTQRMRLDAFLAEQAANAGADFRDGAKVTDLELTDDGVAGAPERRQSCCKCCTLRRRSQRGRRPRGRARRRARLRRRTRGERPLRRRLPRALPGSPLPRARERARRLRLGLPEGRPRQRRRRRLGARGAADAGAPGALLPRVRDPRVRPRGACAAIGSLFFTRARVSPRGDWPCSATRRGSSTRSRATASTRRSSRPSSPQARRSTCSRAATNDLAGYDRELRRALSSQLAAAWGAKVALDRFPRLTYAAVRSPYVWKAVVALIGGEVPRPERDARTCAGPRFASSRRSRAPPATPVGPTARPEPTQLRSTSTTLQTAPKERSRALPMVTRGSPWISTRS